MESSSIFKPYEHYDCWRGDKQTVLKNSIGRQLPFIVNFKNNLCQIFDVEWEKITHSFTFPEGCSLIDVDYFPTKEGQLGILVGVEDPNQILGSENFVVALAADPDEPTMRVTHSAEIPVKITVVKTLFSSFDMAEGVKQETLGLFPRLLSWDHIVAIGCKETRCYLTQLTTVATSQQIVIHRAKKNQINLMSAFVTDNMFQYSQDDGCYRDYPVSAVYISALALMPRSRTLLVGLSMGGVLAAALNPSNQMAFLELRHERLIRSIAPLEPEDDPDKFEYFITAVDRSSRHPVMIQLYRGSFKSATFSREKPEDSNGQDSAEKYDRPEFSVCLEHKIPFGERWLAVNPIVTERGLEGGLMKRRDDSTMDSMLNVSQSYGSTLNRSHVLLAYERKKLTVNPQDEATFIVEAAVFDIDAWYYKRVPGRVSSDGTSLRQCAFMSCIKSEILSENVGDIGILTLCPTDVSRFASMVSDADQLFYPSALSYDRIFVAEKTRISWMKIQNIQQTILDKCASKLPLIIRSPNTMASDILSAGLVRKSILTGSPNSSAAEINETELSTEQKVILNAMVYYGKIDEFCHLATRNDLSDRIKTEIAEWAIHEAVDFKRIISDRTVSLFQGSSTSLSPLAEDTVLQGIKLFRVVYEYLKTCAKHVKDGARMTRLAHSVKCMRNHTKLVSRFIIFHIVPVDHQVQHSMRQMHEKRKNVALKLKTALPIQVITRNMHRLAADTQFWNDLPHDEWYPPTPLDLLESILNVNISERIKRELIVQYIIDWLRANPDILKNEEEKIKDGEEGRVITEADRDKILAMETIKVMTNQMLEVDLEKIYFLLDQEKTALTKKTSSDEEKNEKKVFLIDDDGLTYEKLWSGKVPMALTIGKQDLERFEQRMKLQTEEGGKKKLQVLDPESEMLYQVFLFENQKYKLMSAEAIESNQLLATFPSELIQKGGKNRQKTAKEREIEQSVKTMLERNLKNEEDEMPEVFATIGEKHGKKRKSEAGDDQNSSPAHYVPPTAKRITQWKKAATEEPIDLTASSIASPQDHGRDAEINMMIATPARYYKRPVTAMSTNKDMTSPQNQRPPPVPTQNSILKTAKAVQSPSRGRIRFHESVRRGPNESVDSSMEDERMVQEEAPKPRGLNFAILEDEEEDETATTRHSILSKRSMQEVRPEEEECVEMEKSFENQEEFQVLEDVIETTPAEPREDTFEIRTDDVIPGTDETFELTEREEMPVMEPEEMQVEEVEKTQEIAEEPEEKVDEQEEEPQKEEEEQITEETNEEEKAKGSEDEYSDPWDGIHRSFEVQKDEDCEPVELVQPVEEQKEPVEDEDVFEEAHEELAEDVPLDRTFEVQEDDPQPRADVPDADRAGEEAEEPTPVEVPAKVPEMVVLEEDRPPSANTRSAAKRAANSRSTTPVVPEKSSKSVEPVEKPARKTRAATVEKTAEVQEDEEERPLSRRTRAASVKKEVLPLPEEKPKTPRKARASSVTRNVLPKESEDAMEEDDANTTVTKKTKANAAKSTPGRTPRARTVSRSRAETSPVETSVAFSSRRSVSRSTTPSRVSEEVKKPRKSPARGKKPAEEDRAVTPTEIVDLPDVSGSGVVKRLNSRKSTAVRASSVVPESATSSAKRGAKQTSAPSTPRRGRSRSETESFTEPTPSTKKRRSSETEEPQEQEPPKKARGRPRNTPLKAIPESTEEPTTSTATPKKTAQTPKRTGSRSRNNSTSSVTTAGTTTPKRGRKQLLDEVSEENEDEPEPATPLRRSSRRLQNP